MRREVVTPQKFSVDQPIALRGLRKSMTAPRFAPLSSRDYLDTAPSLAAMPSSCEPATPGVLGPKLERPQHGTTLAWVRWLSTCRPPHQPRAGHNPTGRPGKEK